MHMDHSTATQAHQAAHPHDQHNTLESILMCPQTQQHLGGGGERKPSRAHQQQPQEAIKCPRCQSTNTKFCYYNNYSLAQPRYFCKSCRRYWTKGGTLRNVPVGGGCRRNRRPSSSSSSSSSLKRTTATAAAAAAAYHDDHHDHQDPFTATPFPMIVSGGQLGFHGPQHDFAASYYANGHHHSDDDAAALQYCIPGGFLESLMIKNGDDLLFRGFADQQMSDATIGAAATTTAAMFYNKQEPPSSSPSPPPSSPSAEGERSGGRVLLGCPWQLINGVGEHSDSYGSSLGSFSSPNWYGLLNSPLM